MKKILSLSLLITSLIFSHTTFAQKSKDKKFKEIDSERFFRLGLKGGVNINKINGQSYKSGYNYNYQVGAFFNLILGGLACSPKLILRNHLQNLVKKPPMFTMIFSEAGVKNLQSLII